MEFIDGQDLQAYLVKAGGTLAEDVARFVFQQLVVAVGSVGCLGLHWPGRAIERRHWAGRGSSWRWFGLLGLQRPGRSV